MNIAQKRFHQSTVIVLVFHLNLESYLGSKIVKGEGGVS